MRYLIVVLVTLLLSCASSPAPLFGPFPGLGELISKSDLIAISDITKRPEELDMGSGGIFEVRFARTLKGDAKTDKSVAVYLRDLPFSYKSRRATSINFGLGCERYLLFLRKYKGDIQHDGKPLPVEFENTNYAGDAVWISEDFDFAQLDGKDVITAVKVILKNSTGALSEAAAAIAAMYQDEPLEFIEQRVTPILVSEKPADELASFYNDTFRERHRYVTSLSEEILPGASEPSAAKEFVAGDQNILIVAAKPDAAFAGSPMFQIHCQSQEEINKYWQILEQGGVTMKAGWLKDKFGVFWPIVPFAWPGVLHGTGTRNSHAILDAVLKMDKIDEAVLWKAMQEDKR